MQAGREWNAIFKVLKEKKNVKQEYFILVKLSFRNEGGIYEKTNKHKIIERIDWRLPEGTG